MLARNLNPRCNLLGTLRLKFLNQPSLNDVSFSLSCEDALPITIDLAYEIGKRVEGKAVLTKAENRFLAPGLGIVQLDPQSMPGFRLVLPNGISLNIQSELIRASWSSSSALEYPHFEALLDAVDFFQETFKATMGSERKYIVANACYTNHVILSESGSIFDLVDSNFFPSKTEGLLQSSQYSWKGEHCDLRISLDRMIEENGYVLATSAGLRVGETSEFRENGLILNRELSVLFSELITDQAKNLWQLVKD